MDEAGRRIEAFGGRATSSVVSRLDALPDLERLGDPRVVPFLLEVLADRREPTEVRLHVLRRLRDARLIAGYRPAVAEAIGRVVLDRASPDLRLPAALALAEFTDSDDVVTTLGGLALDPAEPIDVRYLAFTSLQRAGPTTGCVVLLRQLLPDEALGRSARRLLASWRLA
jgi:hypothetical protein